MVLVAPGPRRLERHHALDLLDQRHAEEDEDVRVVDEHEDNQDGPRGEVGCGRDDVEKESCQSGDTEASLTGVADASSAQQPRSPTFRVRDNEADKHD